MEEEEEVLCYLDRVLEEEVFEYGDEEVEPITPLHRQFKVRQLAAGKHTCLPAWLYIVTRSRFLFSMEWAAAWALETTTQYVCDVSGRPDEAEHMPPCSCFFIFYFKRPM